MKKIVIASDSFKESLSSLEVADTVEQAFKSVFKDLEVVKIAMADGGEGTSDALALNEKAKIIRTKSLDPLGREIQARFTHFANEKRAIIDVAMASGLHHLTTSEKNPFKTSSFGTGLLIKEALDLGVENIILGLGGSATNDAGIGIMKALGVIFLDENGQIIQTNCGADVGQIAKIDISKMDVRLKTVRFDVACDVNNPFFGPKGASFIFGPQKGANQQMARRLDKNLRQFCDVIKKDLSVDISQIAGAGAAGGIGGSMVTFLNAQLKRGIDLVLDACDFDAQIKRANLIITGEGHSDAQTKQGKTPVGVAKRACKQNIPTILICGGQSPDVYELYNHYIEAIFDITPSPCDIEKAIKNSKQNLYNASVAVARAVRMGKNI